MRYWLASLALVFVTVEVVNAQNPISPAEIFKQHSGSVVKIEVAPGPAASNQAPVIGTGFIISRDGLVVTAKHVLSGYLDEKTTPIRVRLWGALGGREVSAEPWSFDIGLDVTLLVLPHPNSLGLDAYPVAPRGDARSVSIGDQLYVIGFRLTGPIGISPGFLTSNFGGGPGGNLLWEHNAGVTSGSSGAPVFDKMGHIVGIVKGGIAGTSVNYMYPEYVLEPYAGRAQWTRIVVTPPPLPGGAGNAILINGFVDYNRSAFSFRSNKVVAWNSPKGDIGVSSPGSPSKSPPQFFLFHSAPPYNGPQDEGAKSGIRDMGANSLSDVQTCPTTDYKYHWQEVRPGRVYCVRLRSGDRYVKLKVQSVEADRIYFDWVTVN